jgi:hypothetical protein
VQLLRGWGVIFENRRYLDGDAEFHFPAYHPLDFLVIGAYLSRDATMGDPAVWIGGTSVSEVPRDQRYLVAPAGAVRHAADTGDPSLLIDWLLENACDDRPWLAEALQAAVAGAGA